MTLTVQEGLDELDAFFGVREPVPAKPLIRLHNRGQPAELVAAIAEYMRLPVEFKVSVVSTDTRFRSHFLARTDRSGRGIEGIEAQVAIPTNLPLFGSADLRRFPVGVLITPAFKTAEPETAITILAHELSHVLLHSLCHPERESEVFTDLVPIVLGFGEIVERGRTVKSVTHESGGTRTTTTTYGYLSDSDFSFALERVRSLLSEPAKRRLQLLKDAARLKITATRARAALERFERLRHHLDTNRGQVRKADVTRIVAMHAADYTREIENAIRHALDTGAKAQSFGDSVAQYPKHTLDNLGEHERQCASDASRVDQAFRDLRNGVALLARNCGVRYRIREAFAVITGGRRSGASVSAPND